jgi:hypothetical protein
MAVQFDLYPDLEAEAPELDRERRRALQALLVGYRARLLPGDVGLPLTKRRRVPGLRRGEVAELVGVTVDWYRWFESGRPIRVSPRFVYRLASALRLSGDEALTLCRFAIPELYLVSRNGRATRPSARG